MSHQPEFSVSYNEIIADLLAEDNVPILRAIITAARSTLEAGGRVLFQETYTGSGASPANLATFTNGNDFEKWVNETNTLRNANEQSSL